MIGNLVYSGACMHTGVCRVTKVPIQISLQTVMLHTV